MSWGLGLRSFVSATEASSSGCTCEEAGEEDADGLCGTRCLWKETRSQLRQPRPQRRRGLPSRFSGIPLPDGGMQVQAQTLKTRAALDARQ